MTRRPICLAAALVPADTLIMCPQQAPHSPSSHASLLVSTTTVSVGQPPPIKAMALNPQCLAWQIFSPSRLPSPLGDTGSKLAGVLTHVSKGYVGAALPNPKTAADMPRASGAVITEGTRKASLA